MNRQLITDNLKKTLPYLGIFFVLLMGSGLVKIPVGSVWFYVIKFGIIASVLGLGIYFFYRQLITEYLKLALFVPFTIDFHLHYAFIFLTIILFNKKLLLPWNSPLKPIYLLFIWGFISYIINQFIEFNPLTFPYFVIMFFVPWLMMGLFSQADGKEQKKKLILFFLKVVVVMSLVLILQTIVLWNEHPDFRNGGTIGAHTAALFLALAFLIVLDDVIKNFSKPKFGWQGFFILLTSVPLIFLVDGKYILFLLALALIIYFIVSLKKIFARIITIGSLILLFAVWFIFSNRSLPISIMMWQGYGLGLDGIINNYSETSRGKLLKEAALLPINEPVFFLLGTGPGTFLSHCSRLEGYVTGKREFVTYGFKGRELKNNWYINLLPQKSWVTKKYEQSILLNTTKTGSFYDNRSSLLGIYFEFGIIGLILISYMFYKPLSGNNLDGFSIPIVISIMFILFTICFFELWLERPHFIIICCCILTFVSNRFNN